MDTLVLGMKGQGKTSALVELIREFKAAKWLVIVNTPMIDDIPRLKAAGADWVTPSSNDFKAALRSEKTYRVVAIFDEGRHTLKHDDTQLADFFTIARHKKIVIVAVAHRWTDLHPTVRGQFTRLICFRQGFDDAGALKNEWGHRELLQVTELNAMKYIACTRQKGSVRWGEASH